MCGGRIENGICWVVLIEPFIMPGCAYCRRATIRSKSRTVLRSSCYYCPSYFTERNPRPRRHSQSAGTRYWCKSQTPTQAATTATPGPGLRTLRLM
jgi:hypothetical protein